MPNRPPQTMPPTLDAVRRMLRRYVEGPGRAVDSAPVPKAGETLAAYRARLRVLRTAVLELEGQLAVEDANGTLDLVAQFDARPERKLADPGAEWLAATEPGT